MPAVEGLHLNVACGYATFLAQLESGVPLAARQGTLMATTFHPELASDDRLHCYFIDLCSEVGTGAV
jgi:glutamine amidotransferase PdxT